MEECFEVWTVEQRTAMSSRVGTVTVTYCPLRYMCVYVLRRDSSIPKFSSFFSTTTGFSGNWKNNRLH